MVVFGLDALGNPSHLFNDFKTGIQDFFYEPYQVKKFVTINI